MVIHQCCGSMILACIALTAAARSGMGQPAEIAGDVTPTDVYREAQAVARDIDHIRFYMGRPRTARTRSTSAGSPPAR